MVVARASPFFISICICWGAGNSVGRRVRAVPTESEVWLGGLDSNQDSQIQSLESYQLDDLPSVGFAPVLPEQHREGTKRNRSRIPVDRDSRDSTYLI